MRVSATIWLVLGAWLPLPASAQAWKDLVPIQAANCAVVAPPAGAGIAATPGGFVMVFPRNAALPKDYTGCKALWVLDGERPLRFATLLFERGVLRTGVAHDIHSPTGAVEGACAFPGGKSLLPKAGRRLPDSACSGLAADAFYGLHLPTWPRTCLTTPDAPVCTRDPE